jgi:hypothetical protein
MKKLLAFVLLCFILVSCSSGSDTSDINVTGTWATTFVNKANNNSQAVLDLQLTQSGNSLSGSALVQGDNFGTIQGTKNGSSLEFTITIDPSIGGGTFSVKTSSLSPNSFSGDYTASGGGFGTVAGARSASSGLQSQSALDLKAQLNSLLNQQ